MVSYSTPISYRSIDIFFPTRNGNSISVIIVFLLLGLTLSLALWPVSTMAWQHINKLGSILHVWMLIILIKLTVSKLIDSMATLLLMSYTKVLKITIDSLADLDYPRNKTVSVWLKDANVLRWYRQSWHLFLTVVFLSSLLLLLGYRLYRYSGKRYLHWLNRLRPLLDSYYASYKIHTRYWTGFHLLVHCFLYIVLEGWIKVY